MNTKSGDQLKHSAETGDIGLLYTVIQDDPSILENIDKKQFVETPLHIAARRGHLQFAIEIMNLKPSFATKLNLQGYSPIHLAIDSLTPVDSDSPTHLAIDSLPPGDSDSPTHLAIDSLPPGDSDSPTHLAMDKRRMVSKLVGINEDLVRVKGREGLTPLHIASKKGEVDLLAEFLVACPDSIEDVNVRGESALHIAVIYDQLDALRVLVGYLSKTCQRGARKMQWKILNHIDNAGNTVLHISALSIDPKFLQFLVLVKSGIKLNTKNMKNETALDLAGTELKKILIHAKAKHGSEVRKTSTLAEILRSKTMFMETITTWASRTRSDITEEHRNNWLVVATLVATVTYESALNPPGGVFQVSASNDNNMKITSKDSYYSTRGNAGKSILSRDCFMIFSLANALSFFVSILAIYVLSPPGIVGQLVLPPVGLFTTCFLIAMPAISPTHAIATILYIPPYLIMSLLVTFVTFSIYIEIKRYKKFGKYVGYI